MNITDQFQGPIQHLSEELKQIRAGRATPELVENISVEAYDQRMELKGLASISVQDARTLLVQPWDSAVIKAIEKAIYASNVGLSPVVDGQSIRLTIPALTEERRVEYVKLAKKKAEEAKISLRKIREEVLKGLKDDQKNGVISEDDLRRETKDVQSALDNASKEIDNQVAQKEKEILTV